MIKKIAILVLLVGALYGLGRLYFQLTGGFVVGNITSDFPPNPRWDTYSLTSKEKEGITQALDQEYIYLGKGCQAYVFGSSDGKYVIKFFKYQRFRTQAWIDLFTFLPFVDRYQQAKKIEKQEKLDKVFLSWKIAYEYLQPETGIVYVHLNKSSAWHQSLILKDKLGLAHQIDLGDMEFLLQRQAVMLCPTIETYMKQGKTEEATLLLDKLLVMLLMEYARGFADNDHALMQNTGVVDGNPIHIDVGQFIYNECVRDPSVYKQELYDKTFKLSKWLATRYPVLENHLKNRLVAIIGIQFFGMGPYVHKGDVAKIPCQATI